MNTEDIILKNWIKIKEFRYSYENTILKSHNSYQALCSDPDWNKYLIEII